MRIDNVTLQNWLVHRGRVSLDMAPLTFVVGPNATGKTSVGDGLAFALTADLRRVIAKSDRPSLISEGASVGSVSLTAGGVTITRNIEDGKLTRAGALPLGAGTIAAAVPYLLERSRIAQAEPNDRRQLLRSVMRCDISPEAVQAKLLERGHKPALVQALPPMPADGTLDFWIAHCEKSATEARGGWKAVANTTYGAVKAETWQADAPVTVNREAFAALAAAVSDAQTEADQLLREIGALDAEEKAGTATHARAEKGQQARAMLPDAERVLARVAGEIAAARGSLDAVKAEIADLAARQVDDHAGELACPSCGVVLEYDGKRLQEPEPDAPQVNPATPEALQAAQARQTKLDFDVADLISAEMRAQEQVRGFRAAAWDLEHNPSATPTSPAPRRPNRADLERQLGDARALIDTRAKDLDAARTANAASQQAAKQTERARALHDEVVGWTAIRDELRPDGIPGELLAKLLDPFNTMLASLAASAKWPAVIIDAGMVIRYGGRAYALLSRSEQWRADAMLCIAVAHFSGVRFVILDEFDLLDLPSRRPTMAWLYRLTKATVDTAIIMATMKARPETPPDVTVHWFGPAPSEAVASPEGAKVAA